MGVSRIFHKKNSSVNFHCYKFGMFIETLLIACVPFEAWMAGLWSASGNAFNTKHGTSFYIIITVRKLSIIMARGWVEIGSMKYFGELGGL